RRETFQKVEHEDQNTPAKPKSPSHVRCPRVATAHLLDVQALGTTDQHTERNRPAEVRSDHERRSDQQWRENRADFHRVGRHWMNLPASRRGDQAAARRAKLSLCRWYNDAFHSTRRSRRRAVPSSRAMPKYHLKNRIRSVRLMPGKSDENSNCAR